MPTKHGSLVHLKKELNDLQSKIADLEGKDSSDLQVVKELFSWVAPERVFVARDKKWFGNLAILGLLLLVITLFLRDFLLMGVILAVLFVFYILATVPPEKVENKITTQGLVIHNHSYLWEELADFWFSEKYGQELLKIETYLRFPPELVLLIDKEDKDKIRDLLAKYIPFREVASKGLIDKSSEWFTKKLSSI